jgi:hypothetical protein
MAVYGFQGARAEEVTKRHNAYPKAALKTFPPVTIPVLINLKT